MSDTNKELAVLLAEACNQLPLAASCWNQDDDRELADRNVQHVLGLINRINEALATPHPETPAIDGAEVWERVQRVLSMPNAKKKTGEQLGEAIALSLGLTQTPAPLRGEVSDLQMAELFDKYVGDHSSKYPWEKKDFYDFARAVLRVAAPMPQPEPTSKGEEITVTACYFAGTGDAELSWERDGKTFAITIPVTPEQGNKLANIVWPCINHKATIVPPFPQQRETQEAAELIRKDVAQK